jgi:hypothetical protein
MRLSPLRRGRLFSVGVALLTILAACGTTAQGGPNGSAVASNGPSSAPGPSGTVACKTAGAANLTGWGPPSTPPSIYPVIVANPGELTCGRNRILFLFLDPKNNVISAPNRTAKIALFDLGRDPTTAVASAEGTFVWAIENVRGVYVASVDIPEAGTYGAEFTTSVAGGPPQTIRTTFSIGATTSLIQPGQKAPATKTPTAADVGGDLSKISTDSKPDPALYKTSVDQALAKHQPFLIAFATPKFCTSAQCGPTLDRIKPFVDKFPSVAFIHVEPYQLKFENGALDAVRDQGGNLTTTEVTNAWGLSSEPWVFVVDRQGIVRGSFGLIFSDAELTAALNAVK